MSSWLHNNLKPALKLIGSILSAIGAIIVISAIGKMLIWQPQPLSYYEDTCTGKAMYFQDPRFESRVGIQEINIEEEPATAEELEKEDIQNCLTNRQLDEIRRENNRRKEAMVDGTAMLVVGMALVFLNRKRT